jgi:hypothetical protein
MVSMYPEQNSLPRAAKHNRIFDIRLVVFTAVDMKNAVFWDITPCGSCKNRRFGGT